MPQYESAAAQWTLPFKMGELPIVVWLLVWGAKEQAAPARA